MTKIGAMRMSRHGGPEVLEWQEIELPPLGATDVLVRHRAIGLNFIDTYHRSGAYPVTLPSGIGQEAAGVVEATGAEVRDLRPGMRVAYATAPLGAYADAHVVPRSRLALLPDDIDDITAAALMIKGLTAYYLLHQTYRVTPGDTVLAHAAAGGVGLLLCQWAKHLGAKVIGTVGSRAKAELAGRNGCDHAILYREEDVAKRVRALTGDAGVPVVYDSVGAATFMNSLNCLAMRGLMVSFGNASGPPPPLDIGLLASKGSLFLTRPSLFHHVATQSALEGSARHVFEAVRQGVLRITIGQTYPLRDAAAAHRALEARATMGSTVLTLA